MEYEPDENDPPVAVLFNQVLNGTFGSTLVMHQNGIESPVLHRAI